MDLIFDHTDGSEFAMSEQQTLEYIEKFSEWAREALARGDAGAAGGNAFIATKFARHLEWVRNYVPWLQGDGSALVEALNAHKAELRVWLKARKGR